MFEFHLRDGRYPEWEKLAEPARRVSKVTKVAGKNVIDYLCIDNFL